MSTLKDIQLVRLNETIGRIRGINPQYAKEFNLDEDVQSIDDLQKLPFMTKNILRDGYPYKYACADRKDIIRMHMSSGTTGTPIINPMTRDDVKQWGEIMGRCLSTAGVTSDDIIQITPSFGLFNGGFGFHYGAENIGAYIIPAGAGRSFLQLKFMKDLNTTVLGAISSYPLRLMEVASDEGFNFREDSSLRVGVFGAEVWSDGMRKRIEDEMGIETFDIIGMTETGGVGLGIDCSDHSGIHVWDDHYIVEILHPETGEPLPDGTEGELVVTTLTRQGLPMIRYRTRDITKVITRDKCACGLDTVKIARIKGRTDDMLKVKGVNFYPTQIEAMLMEIPEISNEYRIILEKYKGKGGVTLIIETNTGDMKSETKEKLDAKLYDFLGFHVNLKYVPVGTLDRPAGKAVRVIDNRG